MILYRPVGQKELELIEESDFEKFPPRLDWQPIFYPVLNQRYAEEIANKWNTKDSDSGYCGYVTRFEVDDNYISSFDIQTVGASYHQELWIPAEELENFNSHIIGKIRIVYCTESRTHEMKLNPAPFEMIKCGKKTIELRLYDEKRRKINVGDKIVFTNTEGGEELTVKVVKLHIFDSFEELYSSLPLLKCGYTEADFEGAHFSDMEEYYTVDEQKKCGVLGIEIVIQQ